MEYPTGSDFQPLQPLQVTSFSAVLRQGQLREHGLDRERQDRPAEGGLHRRLPAPPHQPADGLHELFALRRRQYYACTGGGTGCRRGTPPDLLLAGRQLARQGQQHPPEQRIPAQHAGRLAHPRPSAACSRRTSASTTYMNFNYKTIPACTPQNLAIALGRRPALPRQRRHGARLDRQRSGHARRHHRLRRGHPARLRPDRLLRLGRLRHHPARADGQRRDALVSVQGVRGRLAVRDRHRLPERAERPVRRPAARSTSTPPTTRSTYTGFKSRANITWHITPRHADLLHLLGGLPSRRLQPLGQRRGARPPNGVQQFEKPNGYAPDSLTNYEIGHEERVLRPPPAAEPVRLPHDGTTFSSCSSTRPSWATPPSASTARTTESKAARCSSSPGSPMT